MNFRRKLSREQKKPWLYCHGKRMTHKACYDSEKSEYYFCEICGKHAWKTKEKVK